VQEAAFRRDGDEGIRLRKQDRLAQLQVPGRVSSGERPADGRGARPLS
jgi:hypothetical protein